MKTTRTYEAGCTWCQGTGFVKIPNPGFMTSALTGICPVCNGNKTITVTEVTESPSTSVVGREQLMFTDDEIYDKAKGYLEERGWANFNLKKERKLTVLIASFMQQFYIDLSHPVSIATDEDIISASIHYTEPFRGGFVAGAKAHRDGLIPISTKDNE